MRKSLLLRMGYERRGVVKRAMRDLWPRREAPDNLVVARHQLDEKMSKVANSRKERRYQDHGEHAGVRDLAGPRPDNDLAWHELVTASGKELCIE